jgi:FKBP-type peptidyl-prolyl cis-trans isomerase
MRPLTTLIALPLALFPSFAFADELGIEVTRPVDCIRKTKNGDKVSMMYKGTLQKDGSQFDSSYGRGTPFVFRLGAGEVIAGWDQGLLDMCPGEARKLTIPPSLGYGNSDNGPIPAGSTLSTYCQQVGVGNVAD